MALIGIFYGRAVDTEILGFTHDDGVYAILGKSLALGEGFSLLHVVGQPAQIKYPFVYPAILSVVWMLNPGFPDNLILLNAVTIAFTLVACWLIYRYLRAAHGFPGWLALLVLALVSTNYFFIYFFSTVMSEAPYLFFSMLALWYFHREHQRHGVLPMRAVLALVLLSAVTVLTRVTGLALIAAFAAWFLINRQWRNAFVYSLGAFLAGILPWAWWIKTHTPQITPLNYPLINAYSNYGLEFLNNFQAGNYLQGLRTDVMSLMAKLLEDMFLLIPNFFKIYPELESLPNASEIHALIGLSAIYLLCGYFLVQAIATMRKSFEGEGFSPAAYSVPGLYVFIYLLMITLWHYEDQMARFITVITPLLWLYFFKPFLPALPDLAGGLRHKPKAWIALGLLLGFSLLGLWSAPNSYKLVHKSRNQHWVESGHYKWLWGEYKHAFAWINQNLPKKAPLAVGSDVVFHLYTDHPTFYVFYASLYRANNRFLPESIPLLMRSLDHHGVRYLVAEPHMQFRMVLYPMNQVALSLLKTYPQRFRNVYVSPREAIGIYEIVPARDTNQ